MKLLEDVFFSLLYLCTRFGDDTNFLEINQTYLKVLVSCVFVFLSKHQIPYLSYFEVLHFVELADVGS